jgi:hypothetical protein
MSGKMPGKSNDGKRKIMKETIIIQMVVAVAVIKAIMRTRKRPRRSRR